MWACLYAMVKLNLVLGLPGTAPLSDRKLQAEEGGGGAAP